MLQKQLLKQSDKNKSGKKKNTTVADTTDSNKPPHDGMIYDVNEGTWIDMPEVHPDGFDRSAAEEVWSYVNAERTAAGLNALTWDEDIYNFACQRAQAIVSDFSHNGCGNYGENIALNSAGSAYRIHMQWFYSTGHHNNYMLSSYVNGACLVVIAFELEGLTTKEIAEQLGCPEATVKSRLRYGRNNIKTKAEELQKRGYKLYSVAPMPLLLYLLKKEMVVSAAEPSTQLLLSECRKSIAKSTYGAGKTAASTAVKAAGTARKISFLSTAAGKAVIGIVATASIASAVTVGVISYNKSNDKNATAQENVPAVEEVPVNADQPIDGVVEDTETTDAPEDENGSEKYADIPESVLPSSVRNDKDYFEFWDEPVKATCWIDGVKGTIYADWDKTQIIKEVTYDVDGYEDELLIIGSTLDGGTHAIAIYNGQYVVVNDAMWDHWYNGKSSAFD